MTEKENKKMSTTSSKRQPTAAEMREWYQKNKTKLENYEATNEAIYLKDTTKSIKQRNVTSVSKEDLRTYLKNPSNNEAKIRSLSRYLYYRSQIYYRIVKFYANMFDLNSRVVIPAYDITGKNDVTKTIKTYNATLQLLDKMNVQYEFLKIFTQNFRDDLFAGCGYLDDTGFFVLPLDLDYVQIDGIYSDSSFSFSMNMAFFNKYDYLLEFWGDPFQSMYRQYESDGNKWQPMPPEYSVCLKARAEDWEMVISPLVGIFESLINLIELEDIQAIANEEQIYKLLVAKMPLISGSNNPDDWAVSPDIALKYYNKMIDDLPDYVGSALSPFEIEPIQFTDDQATDVTKTQNATKTVLNTSGGAQVLNGSTISGTTAWNGAILSDSKFAISMLLPQAQAVINRLISYKVPNAAKVKFLDVSIYTKDSMRKDLMENATYGLPTRLAVNSLSAGFTELETLALNFLETDCLDLPNSFGSPLVSSHTVSAKESGGQVKDDTELTSEGEASREKRDKSKG